MVVALGSVDPALVTGVLGEEVAFVADPGARDIANAVGGAQALPGPDAWVNQTATQLISRALLLASSERPARPRSVAGFGRSGRRMNGWPAAHTRTS